MSDDRRVGWISWEDDGDRWVSPDADLNVEIDDDPYGTHSSKPEDTAQPEATVRTPTRHPSQSSLPTTPPGPKTPRRRWGRFAVIALAVLVVSTAIGLAIGFGSGENSVDQDEGTPAYDSVIIPDAVEQMDEDAAHLPPVRPEESGTATTP